MPRKKTLSLLQEIEFIALYPTMSAEDISRRFSIKSVFSVYTIAAKLRKEGRLSRVSNNKSGLPIGFCADNKRSKQAEEKQPRKLPANNHTPVFGHHKMIKDRDKSLEKVAVKIDHKTTVYVTPERARTKYGIAI